MIAPLLPARRAAGVLLLVAASLSACKRADDKPKPPTPEVGYVVVKTQSVPLGIELGGRTSAYETSDVRPQVSGVIQARFFEEGSLVKAGQTLYRIDPSLYRAAEAQARANLASAEATREAAEAKAKRYKPLADIEAVSQQDYADALAASRQAAASVAQNKALVDVAAINQRFTAVPAPITGRIGRSVATTGALVTANQTDALTTIQRLDPIFVDIPQSSADLVALRRSLTTGNVLPSTATVRLRLEDGSDYALPGVLLFTGVTVDANTGAVNLRARFPNPDGLLLPGMYVRARLSQSTVRDAILVPQAGVSRDPRGNATVMLVGADDKLTPKTVVADRTVGDQWLISSGLSAGDRVVTEGLNRAKSGQTVKPVPAGSQPSERAADKAADGKPAGNPGKQDGTQAQPKPPG